MNLNREIFNNAADQALASSTTLTDVTSLTYPAKVNERLFVELYVPFNIGGVVSGISFQFIVPAGGSLYRGYIWVWSSTTLGAVALQNASARVDILAGSSGDFVLTMKLFMVNGATANPAKLQFAQAVSNATAVTIRNGSVMKISSL